MSHNRESNHFTPSQEGYFDFERLDAYKLALAAVEFVAARRRQLQGLPGKGGEQLERAVAGSLTNICAGASAYGAQKRRLFKMALEEAGEAGGGNEFARIYYAFNAEEYAELRSILLRECACLRGLVR